MIVRSHGAFRSLSIVTARLHSKRRMRPLHAHEVNGAGLVEQFCCRRRFSAASRNRSPLYPSYLRMSTRKAVSQVWHVSHGFAFAGDSRVVYPRLPLARYHSVPAVVPLEGHMTSLSNEVAQNDSPAGQGAGNVPSDVVTASTTGAIPAATSTVDGAATKADTKDPKPEDPATLVPPFSPLEFKIPDEAFRKARQAAEGTLESFWTYSLYRGPGADGAPDAKVKVHYCTSAHTTERVLKQYFADEKVLGFDLEWAADAQKFQGARKNVCLVQLASTSRIGLFHLAAYPKKDTLATPTLKAIMEDPEITKLGVWIKGDCTRLSQYLGIKARGIFEVSHLYKLVKYSTSGEYDLINKKIVSLANQVKECLDLPLFKGKDVRTSDWSQTLRMDQIIYSASDAYASVQLYATLNHQRENLDPTPPLPHHAELNIPIRLADGVVLTPPEEQDAEADAATEEKPADDDSTPSLSTLDTSTMTANINLTVEPEDDDLATPPPKPTATTATPTKPKAKPKPKPSDPRVAEATLWAAQFRIAHPKTRAAPSSLRAYYLWHKNAGLDPPAIAALLRDPPLQTATVVNYIVEAIRLGKVPFEKRRLREEVLGLLGEEVLGGGGRYEGVLRACQEDVVAARAGSNS